MIIFNNDAKLRLSDYSNANAKISNDIKKGKLFRVTKGIYETDKNTPAYYLSSIIYGPSYISFDFALAYYGLIPELVKTVTCATFNKKKRKVYNTIFGTLTYRDIPTSVYPYGINIIEENGYTYQIATKEKALCDKLYTISPVKNQKEIEDLLFNDLRIDNEEFLKLNIQDIEKISKLYNSTNVKLLYKFMRRKK